MAKPNISILLRRQVIASADGCCEYCKSQERFAPQPFTLDHIIPLSKGGGNDFANLALACQGCNGSKLDKTEGLDPVTSIIVPLFNPRTQSWNEHFAWDDTCAQMIGISAMGRATVSILKTNRKQLVDMRKLLIGFGEHPPL